MSSLTTDVLTAASEEAIPSDLPSIPSQHNLKRTRSSLSHQLQSPTTIQQQANDHQQTAQVETNIVDDVRGRDNYQKTSKKREVFRFQTDWLVSSLAWSNEPTESFNLALCSYIEDYSNRVLLVSLAKDLYDEEIETLTSFEHPYPATKVLWIPRPPDSQARFPQLLATSADYLRLWRVVNSTDTVSSKHQNGDSAGRNSASNLECDSTRQDTEVKLESLLNTNQGMKHCAPLASFDWNDIDPSIIVTASVDTTCAVWDIEVNKQVGGAIMSNQIGSPVKLDNSGSISTTIACNLRNQILAHNHEVYDVSFSRSGSGRDVFVSCGGDGAVRLFDLRRLSNSSVVYEMDRTTMVPGGSKALVRVCCNKQDANYVSTFAINSDEMILLDLRNTGRPLAVLGSHTAELNSMSWAPHSAHHICSASDDHQALIWELSKLPNPVDEPLLSYLAKGKINSISWSASHPDWIAIGSENYLELLRV